MDHWSSRDPQPGLGAGIGDPSAVPTRFRQQLAIVRLETAFWGVMVPRPLVSPKANIREPTSSKHRAVMRGCEAKRHDATMTTAAGVLSETLLTPSDDHTNWLRRNVESTPSHMDSEPRDPSPHTFRRSGGRDLPTLRRLSPTKVQLGDSICRVRESVPVTHQLFRMARHCVRCRRRRR